MNGNVLELLTEGCVVSGLPDGQFVAADDNTGRLTRWIAKRYPTEIRKPESSRTRRHGAPSA